MPPKVGQTLELQNPEGNLLRVTVVEIKEDSVILNANHPLAGETLKFELELVDIA